MMANNPTTVDMNTKLSEPFEPKYIRQKPGPGGRKLNFISHGAVTERLNNVDPYWSSEVLTEHTYKDGQGRLHCEGVTIKLTVGGVSRVEAGGPQRQDGFANEIKNAYSDALKRAAMRFGVALGMWESLVDSEDDEDYQAENLVPVSQPSRPPARGTAAAPARGPVAQVPAYHDEQRAQTGGITPQQIEAIERMAGQLNVIINDRVVADFERGSLTMLTQQQGAKLVQDLSKEVNLQRAAERQQKELIGAGSAGADQYTR